MGATATIGLSVLPGTAAAEPSQATSPEQAQQFVAEASHRLEVVSEKVNEAKAHLDEQQAAVDAAEKAAADAQAQLDALDGQIREIARSAYTSNAPGLTELDVLFSSDSVDEIVHSMGTLDAISGFTQQRISEVGDAADAAQKARAEADDAKKQAQKTLDDVTAQQHALESDIADYQQQYSKLTAEQQAAANRQHAGVAVPTDQIARPAAAAPAAAPAAAAAPVVAAAAPASGAAAVAVQTALAQVGDPYVWGAAGPDAFDCSGLTQYSYAAAGVSLPHSSSMQSQMGTPVSLSALQPGDLLFFYSPVSHVAMYIGNGQMVHASTSGTPVQVVSMSSMGEQPVSARRFG